MTGTRDDLAGELSCIEREFGDWHPWVSSGGRCWATRKGRRPVDPPGWWAMTVDADDPQRLRAEISQQEQYAAQAGAA